MKHLGMLYGANVYLDTDNEHVAKLAGDTLKKAMLKLYPVQTDADRHKEVADLIRQRPTKTSSMRFYIGLFLISLACFVIALVYG